MAVNNAHSFHMENFIDSRPPFMKDLGIREGCLHWGNDAPFLADTLQIVRPSNILEIGYFSGGSAAMFLHLGDSRLTSVDPMVDLMNPTAEFCGSLESVDRLKTAFPDRFSFIQKDSKLVRPDLAGQRFDLAFIDGDHSEAGVRNDFQLAIDLGIQWILVDDFVTSVNYVYQNEFKSQFMPVRVYPRRDQFMGQPIPIVLLRRVDPKISARLSGDALR